MSVSSKLVVKRGIGRLAAGVVKAAAGLSGAPGRPLTVLERGLLAQVFHQSLDLDAMVVRGPVGPVLGITNRAFVIEHTLYLPRRFLPLVGRVLVHEACHAWQFEHGGHAYIGDSLHAQLFGDGYQLAKGLGEGRAWSQLNCEQQATLVEEAWAQGCLEGGRPFVVGGVDRSPELREALVELRAGRGASFG